MNEATYAVPPGKTLEEWMVEAQRFPEQLWHQLGLTEQQMQDFLVGGHPVDTVLSERLEQVTDIPQAFWRAREEQYRSDLAQVHEQILADVDTFAAAAFWRVAEEDTVGGYCIMLEWDQRPPSRGGIVLVGLIASEALALRIAGEHNATLWKPDDELDQQDFDRMWATGTPARLVHEKAELRWPDEDTED